MTLEELHGYIASQYSAEPAHLFKQDPTICIFKRPDNKKWFAIFMNVNRSVLHIVGEGRVDIMNIKCDPILSGSLRLNDGYLPAYHMNHEQWLTILLDGTVPTEDIFPLLDLSFELTMKKYKRKKASP